MSEPNPYEGPKLIINNDKLGDNVPKAPLKGTGDGGTYDGMDGWQASVENRLGDLKTELRSLRNEARVDFRLLFGAIISVALGLAALMAKGFHWI